MVNGVVSNILNYGISLRSRTWFTGLRRVAWIVGGGAVRFLEYGECIRRGWDLLANDPYTETVAHYSLFSRSRGIEVVVRVTFVLKNV